MSETIILHCVYFATDTDAVVVANMSVDYNLATKTIEHNFVVDYNFVETTDIAADFAVLIYHDEL